MDKEKIIVILNLHQRNEQHDLEIPTDITAVELITGLNEAYDLGISVSELSRACLKSENPIALLRGNKLIREYGLHNASVIHFTD